MKENRILITLERTIDRAQTEGRNTFLEVQVALNIMVFVELTNLNRGQLILYIFLIDPFLSFAVEHFRQIFATFSPLRNDS